MPTGYTYPVKDGDITDLRSFALMCSRAFGATMTQRDDPLGDLPKHREMSNFYRESIDKAIQERNTFNAMTIEEAKIEMDKEIAAIRLRNEESEKDRKLSVERYQNMLDQVLEWKSPTPDHDNFKDFMIEQLETSIEHDGHDYQRPVPDMSVEEWLQEKRQEAAQEVQRTIKYMDEEQKRCDDSNAWIDALYASLEPVSANS